MKKCTVHIHKLPEGPRSCIVEVRGFYSGKNPQCVTSENIPVPSSSLYIPFYTGHRQGVPDGVTPRDLVAALQARMQHQREDLARMVLAGGLPSVTDKPDAYARALDVGLTQLQNLDSSLQYMDRLHKKVETD